MEKNNNNQNGGISFVGALTIAFIVLKLCKVISWAWVWVLSPMWITLAFILVFALVYAIIAFNAKIK